MVALILCIFITFAFNADALILPERRPLQIQTRVRKHVKSSLCTSLHGWNANNNNNNDGGENNLISNFFTKASQSINKQPSPTLITPQMEEEVMASARATMDENAVSRAVSSLIDNNDGIIETTGTSNNNNNVVGLNSRRPNSRSNKLRDLAAGNVDNKQNIKSISTNNNSDNDLLQTNNDSENTSWNTQQIAIASGITVTILSPVIIPIIHVLLPPIIPSPSSLSFTGALLLGALSYIIALGDPTDQSNIISGNTPPGGALGESVEVGGAVSRIVGRTALQTAKASAPRVKAVARAALDYDATTATLEDLQTRVDYLSQKTLELDNMNQKLRYEVALFTAVEDVGSRYKLEELKELARYNGVRGYSTESKSGLLRKLVKEQVLELDLTPYYDRVGDRL